MAHPRLLLLRGRFLDLGTLFRLLRLRFFRRGLARRTLRLLLGLLFLRLMLRLRRNLFLLCFLILRLACGLFHRLHGLLGRVAEELVIGVAECLARLLRTDADDIGFLPLIQRLRDPHEIGIRRDDEEPAHTVLVKQDRRIIERTIQGILPKIGARHRAEREPGTAAQPFPTLLIRRALLPIRDNDDAARLEPPRLAECIVEHFERCILDVIEDRHSIITRIKCHKSIPSLSCGRMPPAVSIHYFHYIRLSALSQGKLPAHARRVGGRCG